MMRPTRKPWVENPLPTPQNPLTNNKKKKVKNNTQNFYKSLKKTFERCFFLCKRQLCLLHIFLQYKKNHKKTQDMKTKITTTIVDCPVVIQTIVQVFF